MKKLLGYFILMTSKTDSIAYVSNAIWRGDVHW